MVILKTLVWSVVMILQTLFWVRCDDPSDFIFLPGVMILQTLFLARCDDPTDYSGKVTGSDIVILSFQLKSYCVRCEIFSDFSWKAVLLGGRFLTSV